MSDASAAPAHCSRRRAGGGGGGGRRTGGGTGTTCSTWHWRHLPETESRGMIRAPGNLGNPAQPQGTRLLYDLRGRRSTMTRQFRKQTLNVWLLEFMVGKRDLQSWWFSTAPKARRPLPCERF